MFLIGKRFQFSSLQDKFSGASPVDMMGRGCSHGGLGPSSVWDMFGHSSAEVNSVRTMTVQMLTLHIYSCLVSSFKPSGRSGKMRALSFKTGIACLCGTEVKEKLQCEYNSKVWSGGGWRERCFREEERSKINRR